MLRMAMAVSVDNTARHAAELLDVFVDNGPMTSADACKLLGWTKGRFDSALRHAREVLAPALGLAIPHPTPTDGWRYQVSADWAPVEAGASYSLGMVESRLASIARDVSIVKPHLEQGSKEWRRANFLEKHLTHLLGTLKEIDGG